MSGEPVTPVLVVQGRANATWVVVHVFAIAASIIMVRCAWLGVTGALGVSIRFESLAAHLAFWLPATIVPASLATLLVAGFVRARLGRIEFFPDHIVFKKSGDPVLVQWEDLRAYDDGSEDYVRLVRADEPRLALPLAVPTLDSRDRFLVIDLLVSRGLPRVEG